MAEDFRSFGVESPQASFREKDRSSVSADTYGQTLCALAYKHVDVDGFQNTTVEGACWTTCTDRCNGLCITAGHMGTT